MSSQGSQFLLAISLIFPSKKFYFVFLIVFLNLFKPFKYLDCLYMSRFLQQLLSHQALECLGILTFLECLYHILLILLASKWMISLKALVLWIKSILRPLIELISLLTKWLSSLLFLIRNCFIDSTCSSNIEILTVIGIWSDVNLQSR